MARPPITSLPARAACLCAIAAAVGVLPASAAATCPNANLTPTPANVEQVRAAVVCLIDQEREHHGEGALAANAKLARAAQGHSRDMAEQDYFSHTAPDGSTPLQRMRASGYIPNAQDGYMVGENIAWGTMWLATPQSIVNAWMASPGHRANILDGSYRETGVGVEPRAPGRARRRAARGAVHAGLRHDRPRRALLAPRRRGLRTDNLRLPQKQRRREQHTPWEFSTAKPPSSPGPARGIGRATAELLAADGARVLINDLDGDLAEQTAEEIPGETAVFAGDLTKRRRRPSGSFRTAIDSFGKIDIIVNNAGYTLDEPIHRMTDEQFQAMLDIHVVVPFRIIRAAAPHLRDPAKKEREEGKEVFRKIVNVTSISGHVRQRRPGELLSREGCRRGPHEDAREGVGPVQGQRERRRVRLHRHAPDGRQGRRERDGDRRRGGQARASPSRCARSPRC